MKDPFSYVFLLKIKVFFQVEKKIAIIIDAQNLAKHYKKKRDKILLCLLSVDRD